MKHIAVALSLLALGIALVSFFRSAPPADAFATAAITNASAGIYARCETGVIIAIQKQFNNVNTKPIRIEGTGNQRECLIKFPFKVDNHPVVATASGTEDNYVTISPHDSKILRLNFHGESVGGGSFFLVVY